MLKSHEEINLNCRVFSPLVLLCFGHLQLLLNALARDKSSKEDIRNYAVKPLQKSSPIVSKLRLKFCITSKRDLWAGGEERMDTATQPWRRGRKLVLQMASVLTFCQQNRRLQVVTKQTSKSIFIQSFCCFSCSCCFCALVIVFVCLFFHDVVISSVKIRFW